MDWAKTGRYALLFLSFILTILSNGGRILAAEQPLRDVAPTREGAVATRVSVDGGVASFEASTAEGKIRYVWSSPAAGASNWLGKLTATIDGRAELHWEVQGMPQWVGGITKPLTSAAWTQENGGAKLALAFGNGATVSKILLSVSVKGEALVINLTCDQASLTALDLGGWSLAEGARALEIPYNPFSIFYFQKERIFTSSFFDWTDSNATKQNDSRLIYAAKTNGNHNILRDRFIIAIGRNLRDVFANAPAGRSRFFDDVAGRVIINIATTEKFDQINAGLKKLIQYGLSDCILMVHNWQRDGYDNGFPAHYPANKELGGDSAILNLISTAKSANCTTYLHENFIDYYPNYEKFSENDISRETNGDYEKAWFNKKSGIQSFNLKPSRAVELAIPIAKGIQDIYQTGGVFLDVNPSFRPWDRVDMDASVEEAGMFRGFFDSNRKLFSVLQDIYQGPLVGEGHNHFFWTGLLDGVEAQVTVGYKGEGVAMPVIPDFDLLKIHDYQSNFGMGFFFRWSKEQLSGVDWKDFKIEHDRETQRIYRAQEIVFGHNAWRTGVYWSDINRFWQEEASVGALSKVYAVDHVQSISYLDQNRWVGIEAILASGHPPSVIRITYSSGLEITANFDEAPFEANGHVLPKGGWLARKGTVVAYEASENGAPISFSHFQDLLFADGRSNSDSESDVSTERSFENGLVRTNGVVFAKNTHGWKLQGWLPKGGGHAAVNLAVFGGGGLHCMAPDGGDVSSAVDGPSFSITGAGYFQCEFGGAK